MLLIGLHACDEGRIYENAVVAPGEGRTVKTVSYTHIAASTAQPVAYDKTKMDERDITLGADGYQLPGTLTLPKRAVGPAACRVPCVILVHGSGPVSYTHLTYSVSAGMLYRLLNNKLSLSLNVNNLFVSHSKLETMSNGLKIIADNQFAFASFRIGVSYTFGGDIRSKGQRNSNEDIQRRL